MMDRSAVTRVRHSIRFAGLAVSGITTLLVFASIAWGAGQNDAARSATACSHERIGNSRTGEAFYAFVLHGRVSCSTAQHLIRTYFHKVSAGKGCTGRGTQCGYKLRGGWYCGLPGYAGSGFSAGCCRTGRAGCRAAKVKVYEVSPPATWHRLLHLHLFASPDGRIACEADNFSSGYMRCSIATSSERARPAAYMERGGVTVCDTGPEGGMKAPEGLPCTGLRLERKVILAYGQDTQLGDIRCVSGTDGITCTFVSGKSAGKGFRINKNEAVEIR